MKKNMGLVDKFVRLLIAMAIVILELRHLVTGTFSIILTIVAVILIITTFIGFCPLYTLFGWNTNKKK
jgi:hypothetical protein